MENVEDGNLTRRQKHRKMSRQHTLITVKATLRHRFFLNGLQLFLTFDGNSKIGHYLLKMQQL